MSFIWAARGRAWGFTFLSRAGLSDPLAAYEQAMNALGGAREGCARAGDAVALKFVDPEGRSDRSGRPISHAFVLYGEFATKVASVEDGLREVWPLVAGRYAEIWADENGPSA